MTQTEFSQWAKKACRYCCAQIQDNKIDLYFYAFQSPPIIDNRPEVLILGLNPSVDPKYDGKYPDFKTLKEEAILNRFTQGNPCFQNKHKWRIWQGLQRVFTAGNLKHLLEKESSYLYMNILYFNTPNMSTFLQLDKEGKIFNECVQLTGEFIQLLRPKKILCLSIKECFNRLSNNIQDTEELIPSYLARGVWNGIPIYGIRHTSRRYRDESTVGQSLGILFNKPDISKEKLLGGISENIHFLKKRTISLKSEELITIANQVRSSLCNEFSLKIKQDKKDSVLCSNDKLSITITHTGSGYIGIRHTNFHGRIKYSNNTSPYNKVRELRELLIKYGYATSDVWLGQKRFTKYTQGHLSTECIYRQIRKELSEILPLLNSILEFSGPNIAPLETYSEGKANMH